VIFTVNVIQVFLFADEYLAYQVGLIASGFYVVLGEKDMAGFQSQTLQSLGLILAVTFVSI